jgi:hypothetical protein
VADRKMALYPRYNQARPRVLDEHIVPKLGISQTATPKPLMGICVSIFQRTANVHPTALEGKSNRVFLGSIQLAPKGL